MREREPMTQIMKASDARARWSQVLNQVARRETRVLIEKSGVPVAAIIAPEDLERFNRMEEERAKRWRVVEEIGARNADKDPDEVERDIAEAIAEVRAEQREKAATLPKA